MAAFWGGQKAVKRSAYFRLQKIEITLPKARFLTKERVIKRSGLILGENLFEIDLKKIKTRLELDPWIAKAFVSRKLPDTIYLKVEEERPLAMVSTPSAVWLVNERGEFFAKATLALMKELPALVGLSKSELKAHKLLPSRKPILQLLSYLKNKEGLVPPYANISQLKLEPDGFWLLTRDALRIRFAGSSLEELLYAYRKLDRILVYLYETDQYHLIQKVRLDYPPDKAALVFKKARRKG